jgi:hypothetical protein
MFTVLIAGIIGAIISIAMFWNHPWVDAVDRIGDFVICTLVFGLVGCLVAVFIGSEFEQKSVVSSSQEIVALKDNSQLGGSFFLGTGSVDEEPVYFYMAREEGGVIQKTIDVDKVVIVEGSENPRIEKYKAEFVDEKNNRFGLAAKCNKTKIFVPSGSVERVFNVDME